MLFCTLPRPTYCGHLSEARGCDLGDIRRWLSILGRKTLPSAWRCDPACLLLAHHAAAQAVIQFMRTDRHSEVLYVHSELRGSVAGSASRNLLIISKGDPENSPEYSEFHYLCGNYWLQELLQQERAVVCSQIRQERIDRAHLHTVVRDYLVAHAYEDTLSHFDQAYNQRALPCLCARCSASLRRLFAVVLGVP